MAKVEIFRSARRDLPPYCMCCGEPPTTWELKRFSWAPPWVLILFFVAGLIPWLIVWLITTKRMSIEAPLCFQHRNHWKWRRSYIGFGFLVWVCLGIATGVVLSELADKEYNEEIAFGMLIAFVVWIISAALISHNGIRPEEIRDNRMVLVNVSRAFADAVEDEEDEWLERKRRRTRREQGEAQDEDDDPNREPQRDRRDDRDEHNDPYRDPRPDRRDDRDERDDSYGEPRRDRRDRRRDDDRSDLN